MYRKKKSIEVYKDGELISSCESIIEAIYDLHISYASIKNLLIQIVILKAINSKIPSLPSKNMRVREILTLFFLF